jgi:hypothetical protein
MRLMRLDAIICLGMSNEVAMLVAPVDAFGDFVNCAGRLEPAQAARDFDGGGTRRDATSVLRLLLEPSRHQQLVR